MRSDWSDAGFEQMCQEHQRDYYEKRVREMDEDLKERYGIGRSKFLNRFNPRLDEYMEEFERRRSEIDREVNFSDWF
ncbi:MAG TPA: hypothetical protein HA362_04495 [Nanoarchaeota archaeon]|nr:hypothetical protein [Nanoarchaeota archaeon]